jgi:segregation and condensation protein B
MKIEEYKPVVDALIFASDTPLNIQKIKQILEEVSKESVSTKDIREIIEELNKDNRERQRGFYLQEVAGGYQFRTRPNYAMWVKKLKKAKPFRLTQSTMETLAIVAYKQPVIKTELEKIRGVDSGGIIKNLLERNLIKIVGRKNIPGRPFLLGTTKRFLEVFGLEKLSDLPTLKEFENLDESQLPTILRDKISKKLIEGDEQIELGISTEDDSDFELSESTLEVNPVIKKNINSEPISEDK